MRVAIYARVSKDEQAQEGLSLGAQEERCRAFAFAKGWQVVQVYVDAGVSGKSLQRPAIQRLLADAAHQVWDVVLIWKLDRLSRRQKDILHLLEDVFHPHNIGLQSATEPFDTTTPMGKAMLGMLAVFAQLERETIVERTKMGRAQSLKLGRWQGGKVPYGYQHTGQRGILAPDPATAPYVQELFRRAATGEGPTLLAHDLNRRGIPAPQGGPWADRVIWGLLQSPVYVGEVGRYRARAPGHHPPLVDRLTWERVQREFARRAQGPRSPRTDFLVDGLLRCPVCGDPIRGRYVRPGRRPPTSYDDPVRRYRFYYLCARRQRAGRTACDAPHWHAPAIDRQVLAILRTWRVDPQALDDALRAELPDTPPTGPDALATQWEQLQERATRWYDAFEQGVIDAATLRQRLDRLRQAQSALEAERRAATPPVAAPDVRAFRGRVADLVGHLFDRWDLLLPHERMALVREVIAGGTISRAGQVTLQPALNAYRPPHERA